MRCLLIALLLVVLFTVQAPARTWQINPSGTGDAPTIQAGIDSAAAGDSVVLASGTFTGPDNRDLSFRGKPITVTSLAGDATSCIIDCGGSVSDMHTGFVIDEAEGVTTVLSHVTIRGGYYDNGGGLVCATCPAGYGGFPTIMGCTFEDNTAVGYGGAILVFTGAFPTIVDCDFRRNVAGQNGGAIMAHLSRPAISLCEFHENSGRMGGAVASNGSTLLSLTDCVFKGNWSTADSDGGAMYFFESTVVLTRCISQGNRSKWTGGSIHANDSSLHIVSSTFVADSTGGGATLACRGAAGSLLVENTVIAFSRNSTTVYCFTPTGTPAFSCCDVYGNSLGDWVDCIAGQNGTNGNISQDPLFCNIPSGDLTVEDCSPCLGANNSCGQLIGAGGSGCGCGEATEPTTWGGIKSLYR